MEKLGEKYLVTFWHLNNLILNMQIFKIKYISKHFQIKLFKNIYLRHMLKKVNVILKCFLQIQNLAQMYITMPLNSYESPDDNVMTL